jgi:hypothetical protein
LILTKKIAFGMTSEADRGRPEPLRKLTPWEYLALGVGILAAHLASHYNYLLFHTRLIPLTQVALHVVF